MSTLEETRSNRSVSLPAKTGERSQESLLSKFLGFLCSVRLGIVLLILLGLACLLGMLIMQQNVDGFDRYYAELTASQKLVYGTLGFFDIYHAWYFNALLAFLSLNIILASFDRFPQTLTFITKPKVQVSAKWLRGQNPNETVKLTGGRDGITGLILTALKKAGWRKISVTEKNDRAVVFAQTGVWNRFGAYAVHVGLLTIFLGGFLTAQFGHTGQMPLAPGQKSDQINETVFDLDQLRQITKRLPFEVYCTDIEQKLIKKEGSISANNTIDWLTRIRIEDETGAQEAVVRMNQPFDYRGYRFFQASFVAVGRARSITLRLTDQTGAARDINIRRDGSETLPDGTKVRFSEFRGNFSLSPETADDETGSYQNPAAILEIKPPGENSVLTAYAFTPQMANIPAAQKYVGGYKYQLLNFEKVGDQHILAVQRDPGSSIVYLGFILLFVTLVAVFFFSHQRVWAIIEEISPNQFEIVFGGHTNRNQNAFVDKFSRFVKNLRKQATESQLL